MVVDATTLQGRINETQSNIDPNATTNYILRQLLNKPTKDSVSLSGKSKCTDGKDDGKIGMWSALGNAVIGAGKTAINGLKSMFTNKEGKFSIGKTLLTLGTGALCCAFPPIAVAFCAVGGVMGAMQLAKGIRNVATAKTDGEAKEAWQNIGGGTFTAGMSVAGARTGIKATKASSTANAMNNLDKSATFGQKLSAFGKDALSSMKNGFKNIRNIFSNIHSKWKSSEIGKAFDKLKVAKKSNNAEDIAAARTSLKNAVKGKATNLKDSVKDKAVSLKDKIKQKNDKTKSSISDKEAKKPIFSKDRFNEIKNSLSERGKEILEKMQSKEIPVAKLIQEYGYSNVQEVLTALAGEQVASESV